jgi:hypothetical protein
MTAMAGYGKEKRICHQSGQNPASSRCGPWFTPAGLNAKGLVKCTRNLIGAKIPAQFPFAFSVLSAYHSCLIPASHVLVKGFGRSPEVFKDGSHSLLYCVCGQSISPATMSVSATGLALAAEAAEDSKGTNAELEAISTPDDVHPIAPDQFDPRYETTKWEIWAYYAYYIGNNGLTLFNFAPTAFQNLLYEQAGNTGLVHFLGRDRDINSIVLLANGISFAIQVVLFLVLGSFADYGTWRPYILIFWSIVAFGLGFGWLGVHTVDKWPVATGLYMIGLIAYQMCITFWTAAFPGLARNTPELRLKAEQYEAGEIDREKYDFADMMQRNRIQNVAFIVQSAGEILILAVIVGIMWGLNVNASTANNNWGLSVLIAFATGVWLLFAIPLFVIEKRRPGQPLPPNMNIVSVGFWQLYRACKQIWRLKQSLLYLVGEFGKLEKDIAFFSTC